MAWGQTAPSHYMINDGSIWIKIENLCVQENHFGYSIHKYLLNPDFSELEIKWHNDKTLNGYGYITAYFIKVKELHNHTLDFAPN